MKKGFRNERGITLATLAIYIISLLFALAVLALVTTYFRSNLNDMKEGAIDTAEYDKFNSYFLEEVKRTNNEIKDPEYETPVDRVSFTSGNRYLYETNDSAVYLVNEQEAIKIAEKVESCFFNVTRENEKTVITVTIKIGNDVEPRETKYVMEV